MALVSDKEVWVKIDGTWTLTGSVRMKNGGSWVSAKETWVKNAGSWVQVTDNKPTFSQIVIAEGGLLSATFEGNVETHNLTTTVTGKYVDTYGTHNWTVTPSSISSSTVESTVSGSATFPHPTTQIWIEATNSAGTTLYSITGSR